VAVYSATLAISSIMFLWVVTLAPLCPISVAFPELKRFHEKSLRKEK